MGLIFKARGNASIAPLMIRLSIGILFLVAGAIKIVDLQGFVKSVQDMNVLPDNLAFILGFILPFAEIILGGLYLIGFFTPIVSILMSFMIIGIIGTTGAGDPTLPFTYNFIFLACTVSTIFSGAGMISFDAMLDRKKSAAKNLTVTSEVNPAQVSYEPVNVAETKDEIEVELIEEIDTEKKPD